MAIILSTMYFLDKAEVVLITEVMNLFVNFQSFQVSTKGFGIIIKLQIYGSLLPEHKSGDHWL